MSIEATAAEAWIAATFMGDATIVNAGVTGVFSETVTEGTLPYIILTQTSDLDERTYEHRKLHVVVEYIIRVIMNSNSWIPLQPIADRMDTLLDLKSGNANGHLIMVCERLGGYQRIEGEGYAQYRHLGGHYRILVQ